MDELISVLEQRNLDDHRALDRGLREHLRGVEADVGLPLPRQALRARNTARLHAALMDWREILVDELRPGRPDIDDTDADDPG